MSALFICGCGHSGTSLVANMFAANPNVFIPLRETSAFLQQKPNEFLNLFAEFKASGRPHLVEKTPRHVLVLDRIRQTVPGAKFLLMVRDGRDVAASFIKRSGSADAGISRWLSENAIVLKEGDSPDCIILRYEDLITAPEAHLRKVCAFAGIEFDAAMLNYHRETRMWFGVHDLREGSGAEGEEHRMLRNWQINQPIFDGRGAWRGKLSETELAMFHEGQGGELMRTFGYVD